MRIDPRFPEAANLIVPTVIEKEPQGYRVYDIYSRLLKDNIVFLGTEVDAEVANLVIAQLLFLEQQSVQQDVYMYINSPGGSLSAGLAIYDTMNYIRPDVHTICVGQAASMGAFLLAGGAQGKRSILPHAQVMIHQPWASGITGQITDIEIATRQLQDRKKMLNQMLAKNTGQRIEQIARDVERDLWMTPTEAKKYGLVDNVIQQRPAKS